MKVISCWMLAMVVVAGTPCTTRKTSGFSSSSTATTTTSQWLHVLDGVPFLMEKRRPGGGPLNYRSTVEDIIIINNNNNRIIASVQEASNEWRLPGGYPSFLHQNSQHRSLEFGDYVDPTYSCPPMTTCPVVCVVSIQDCPQDALCPGTHPEKNEENTNPNHEYEVRRG
jgi:hypothetical protein